MPKKIAYAPLPFQSQFHYSTKPKAYLSAGFGAGKTYALVMKMFYLMTVNRGLPGGLLCPTLKMYKRDVLPTIKTICRINHIRYHYNKSDMEFFFPDAGCVVYVFHSEDDGESIKGPNLAWFVINEVSLCSRQAFLMALARIRVKSARLPQIAMSGTPEGFNWAYDYFIENPREDTDLIFGDSRLNTFNSDSYIQTLEDSYDPLMQEQYIKGLFVNLNGKRCAWSFNRLDHVKPAPKIPGMPVWVSMDFNVTPMAATLWNLVPFGLSERTLEPLGHTLRAWSEIRLESSNTYEMCTALRELVNPETESVTIYPDPAGRARSTKSMGTSDIDILRNAGFTNLKYKLSVSVKDCLNAMNSMMSKNLIVVDPSCRNTIADLEQCVFKQGLYEVDKSNQSRSHWLDGTKNMIDYEFPIRKPQAFREERYR